MKQAVIDGTVETSLAVYEVPDIEEDLVIDFIDQADLLAIEEGIRRIQATSDLLALVQGVAIVKIEREGLWRQGGYNNLKAYRIAQNERLGMPRQTVSRRRLAGEGYLDNRKALGKFPLKGHVEKLRLLNEAVDKYGKREAITKFKSSTLKEFIRWVRPSQLVAELYRVKALVDDQGILIEGKPKVYWSKELDELERKWISSLMERAYNARNGGNLAHVVEVYDEGEARAVDNFLKKLRSKK